MIGDRIEAGTFLVAGPLTGGDVTVQGIEPRRLRAVISTLRDIGVEVIEGEDFIRAKSTGTLRNTEIVTLPYPGFPTDLQAQFMTLMCVADGWSMIRETVFENRFIHVSELQRMGADIEINGNQALVKGSKELLSAPVMATDLRASASLILAALVAKGGPTEVHRIYHLDRGYENLEEKFKHLGATIRREKA